MTILILLSIAGIFAGFLLLRTIPIVHAQSDVLTGDISVSVIIPARDEAANLPPLLHSLHRAALVPKQIIVVDDASSDSTADIARQHGATVIPSAPLPVGWTGKTWACYQGALAATGDTILFLDADTRFIADGYVDALSSFAALPKESALSILPFHCTHCWYEELSVFFNILVAIGAGGFGKLDRPHLFGQSLFISRDLYHRAGCHASVRHQILENLHFSARLRKVNASPVTLSGRGTLEMRMFPGGLSQLRESWKKAFADGASITTPVVLALSIYWLSAAMFTAILAIITRTPMPVALYIVNVAQIFWYARQLGTFRLLTALFYPTPLVFDFAVFAQSLSRQKRRKPVTWRGRQL